MKILLLCILVWMTGVEIQGKKELYTYNRLSEYNFFSDLKNLVPNPGVVEYKLSTPLFTDYAWKKRFVFLPDGKLITYKDSAAFDFPEGSVLIKNFYYPADFRKPEEQIRMLETRLLLKYEGKWKALPYIWNEEQNDAILTIQGGVTKVQWKHYDGKKRKAEYLIPNINQCKGCHSVGYELKPIGMAARHLSGPHIQKKNQLQWFADNQLLKGLPPLASVPRNADWKNEMETIDRRARSWLDINCAHCHDEKGPASNTGLYLSTYEKSLSRLGIMKPPVAAGRGSEDMLFDIVPGKPGESILLHRMITDDIGERMPELGRSIMDKEAVELIRKWIEEMD